MQFMRYHEGLFYVEFYTFKRTAQHICQYDFNLGTTIHLDKCFLSSCLSLYQKSFVLVCLSCTKMYAVTSSYLINEVSLLTMLEQEHQATSSINGLLSPNLHVLFPQIITTSFKVTHASSCSRNSKLAKKFSTPSSF